MNIRHHDDLVGARVAQNFELLTDEMFQTCWIPSHLLWQKCLRCEHLLLSPALRLPFIESALDQGGRRRRPFGIVSS